MTHNNSVPEILFPINDLNAISEQNSDEDLTGNREITATATAGVGSPPNLSSSTNSSTRIRKRSFLPPSRKLSVDGWVDINANVIEEEETENTFQHGGALMPRPVTPTWRPKRVSFDHPRRSFSSDSWVELDCNDVDVSSSNNGKDVETTTATTQKGFQNTVVSDGDRLQVQSAVNYSSQRRESFLYRSDSDNENSQPPRTSRHSSISSEGVHSDELVTPFAQVLSSLKSVRATFVLLTNLRQNRMRRGSEGFHLNSRLCQLYEISDGSVIRDDTYKKMTMEALKEFDWCLNQLDSLKASMSISEMASNKFKRLLDRELKDFSETGVGGQEISAWVFDTFVDKSLDNLPTDGRKLRARSKSLVKSLKKLSRSVSSGAVPRFGTDCRDESVIEKIFEKVDTWEFDVFKLAECTGNRPLATISYTILQTRDLLKIFKIKPWVFTNYISLVENHYIREVPFHNSTHAADVFHATHVLLSASSFEGVFNDLEILAVLIAAAVHDVDHPGVNNMFLVNTSSEMALLYNDESVLENHHLAVAFQLMQNDNCDILESFSKSERQQVRKMVIDMVLATDNAKHMNILGSLKTMVETKKLSEANSRPVPLETSSEKMHVLKCLVHCADLSNPTRPLEIYETWVDRLMEEFFRQGDIERERGMEISPMMDRQNANVDKSQVIFIDYVVHPLWEAWADLVYPEAQDILANLQKNREHYQKQRPVSPTLTPTITPKNSPFPARKSMPAIFDLTQSTKPNFRLSMDDSDNKQGVSPDRPFLIRNDIKLFQNQSGDDGLHSNNNNNLPKGLFNIDRRRSESDVLKHSFTDVKLARQRLLKIAHVNSTESEHDVEKLINRNAKNAEKEFSDLKLSDVIYDGNEDDVGDDASIKTLSVNNDDISEPTINNVTIIEINNSPDGPVSHG